MERKTIWINGRRVALAVCGLLIGTAMLQSCKDDDVLTGQPSWLGNSIYERLQDEGKYTTTLRLIDDLDLKEVLGHTGSKTLFAADDDAYANWFKSNDWGVTSYEQLTLAQKRMLLNNSMINNAYLIELMSNVSGTPPVEGKAMRRETASSIYDSVYVMKPSEMPDTKVWENFKSRGKSIPIFKDATSAPMIHFLPAFMSYNKITDEDLTILTNGQATSASEAWVNGKKVIERDITCKNGYIQKVADVIESSPNMAEIIHQDPRTKTWARLIDRFSAPYFYATGTREYNRIYNNEDSVYILRYFSSRSSDSQLSKNVNFDRLPGETNAHATLRFDPGWNQYTYNNTMDYDLHYDAGAMIVPTDEAVEEWWNDQGKDLQDEYHLMDSIPDATLSKLINVNMLDVFTAAVPSKFNTVLNDAKEVLGIKKENVVQCYMGCNGVVYVVNKVFTPAEYSSVAYPALAHESTMNVIYWVIDQRNFLPYLLSMDSKYALILPNNNAMLMYLDPASYGEVDKKSGAEAPNVVEFVYDRKKGVSERVQAASYDTNVDENGNIVKTGSVVKGQLTSDVINTMVEDMMNQLIIVLADKTKNLDDYVDAGYTMFKTKGGTMLRITRGDDGRLNIQGGWQMEYGRKEPVVESFTKVNGRSYLLDSQMPLSTKKSLYMTLMEHDEYSGFKKLLNNGFSDLLAMTLNNKYNSLKIGEYNYNMRLFDNYNYTVFIPSTQAIEDLQAKKLLPNWQELERGQYDEKKYIDPTVDSICIAENWYPADADEEMKKDIRADVVSTMRSVVTDFIRYHVMDRSVAIGMAPEANSQGNFYESMKRNPETGRFFRLEVEFDQKNLTVKDIVGNTRSVKPVEGLYNNICREYWFKNYGTNNATIYMASSAVSHLIDQPLYYGYTYPDEDGDLNYDGVKDDQDKKLRGKTVEMRPWRETVREALVKYKKN